MEKSVERSEELKATGCKIIESLSISALMHGRSSEFDTDRQSGSTLLL